VSGETPLAGPEFGSNHTLDLDQSRHAASAIGFVQSAMEKGMLRCRKLLLALAIMMATPGVVLAQATDTKPAQP